MIATTKWCRISEHEGVKVEEELSNGLWAGLVDSVRPAQRIRDAACAKSLLDGALLRLTQGRDIPMLRIERRLSELRQPST